MSKKRITIENAKKKRKQHKPIAKEIETKRTLGVEGKGQQMSFRMTHESFGPWRDSTVCVSLACGSIVRHRSKVNPRRNIY